MSVVQSKRSLRVSESLKRVISDALNQAKLLVHVIGDIHVTVSEVKLSGDLRSAIVYILPQDRDNALEIVSLVNEYSRDFNSYLGKETNLKFLPKLNFKYDDLFDKMNDMDNLLSSVDD